jgi:hypothetical protein
MTDVLRGRSVMFNDHLASHFKVLIGVQGSNKSFITVAKHAALNTNPNCVDVVLFLGH